MKKSQKSKNCLILKTARRFSCRGPGAVGRFFWTVAFPIADRAAMTLSPPTPIATLVTRGSVTEIREGGNIRLSPEDPFKLVKLALGNSVEANPGLPFYGGAIGYFSYDLARRLEKLPAIATDEEHIPDMVVGIYDWALVVDHVERRSWLVGQGRDPATLIRWPHLCHSFSQIPIINWPTTASKSQTLPSPIWTEPLCRSIRPHPALYPRRRLLPSQLGAKVFRRLPRQPMDRL